MKAKRFLAVLERQPLGYEVVRQSGSHRRMRSPDHPPLTFSFHDSATIPASLVRKILGVDFPGFTSPMVSRLAHVHIPDELRRPNSSIEIPGFGLLPFGHSRFDRGGIIYAEFEPGRSMLGTIEFGPPVAEVPMSLAELRESARRRADC